MRRVQRGWLGDSNVRAGAIEGVLNAGQEQ